jgi:hypothetical protein
MADRARRLFCCVSNTRLSFEFAERAPLGRLFDAESLQFWLAEGAQYLIDRLANVSNELTLTVLLACLWVWPSSNYLDARAYVDLGA